MKKYYYIIIAFLSLWTLKAQTTRSGIYDLPLTGTSKPDGIVVESDKGNMAPSGTDRYTTNGMVLSKYRVGYSGFAINDLEIDPREGIVVEFDYAMAHSGTVYGKGGGMSFFVFNAQDKFKLGYRRTALGYAYNLSYSTDNEAGMPGGYLGIAFDSEGSFKTTGDMKAYELREGIDFDFGKFKENHITLRGATQYATGGDHGFGVHHFGNPVLLTKYFGRETVYNGDITEATIDYSDGSYDFSRNNEAGYFNIGEGGTANNPNFQTIRIELVPDTNYTGMYVTIKGKDNYGDFVTLVDEFYYPNSFTAFGKVRWDNNGKIEGEQYDFETRIPDRVKIGFAGYSFDNVEQTTIIKNIKVSTSEGGGDEGVDLENEYEEICISKNLSSEGAVAFIDILEDTDYNVDWRSFMFVDENGNKIGSSDDYYADYYTKWEYDSYDRQVKMTVQFDFYKPEENLDMYYSIEVDGVRSKPAKITVRSIECGAIANPQINTKSDY